MARLRDEARMRWEAGPAGLDAAALEDRRYRLSVLLDDLAEALVAGLGAALAGDAAPLLACGRTELDRAGGRLDHDDVRYA